MLFKYGFYVIVFFLSWFFALLAERHNDRRWLVAIIMLLSLFVGLRGYRVGYDTYGYLEMFRRIAAGKLEYAYGLEDSFKFICYGVSKISKSPTFFLLFFSFLTNIPIILRMWDLRDVSSFSCMVVCYCCCFYFMLFNGIRQFCAVAIVFYATRYLEEGKGWMYLLGVVIAAQFHQSAYLGIVLILMDLVYWKDFSKVRRRFLILGIMAIPLVLAYIIPRVSRYRKYFVASQMDVGIMVPLKMLFFVFCLLFLMQNIVHQKSQFSKDCENSTLMVRKGNEIAVLYFLGLSTTALGYFFPLMDRISWYFYIFEGAFYGMLLKDQETVNRVFFCLGVTVIVGYVFLNSLLHNSQGNVPYLFYWQ